MMKANRKSCLPESRFFKWLLVLLLILVAFYSIFDAALDAYSDHLTHPVQTIPDDRTYVARHHQAPKNVVFLHRVPYSALDGQVFYFFRTGTLPAVALTTSQECPPVSSDLSPPVV
jgi:hypothetical protein